MVGVLTGGREGETGWAAWGWNYAYGVELYLSAIFGTLVTGACVAACCCGVLWAAVA